MAVIKRVVPSFYWVPCHCGGGSVDALLQRISVCRHVFGSAHCAESGAL